VLVLFLYKEFTMGMYGKKNDMSGKVVVITGGNSGIGLETARGLAEQGATVILGCRSKERGKEAVADIKRTTFNENVKFLLLDLRQPGAWQNKGPLSFWAAGLRRGEKKQ